MKDGERQSSELEFKLTKPIDVYDKNEGVMKPGNVVSVVFYGVKGLKAIKKLQDIIMRAMQKAFSDSSFDDKKKEDKKPQEATPENVAQALKIGGHSEEVFSAVMDTLKDFATIGTHPLDETKQNELSIEDAMRLYGDVLLTFLLVDLCQTLNSMNK